MKKLLIFVLFLSLSIGCYTQVYVVGTEYTNYRPDVLPHYASSIKYWKNSECHTILDANTKAYATDIFVSDTNIYIVGAVMDTTRYFDRYYAFLWHNGNLQYLTDSSFWSTAYYMTVVNGDVYIAGTVQNSSSIQNKIIATLWKNGVAQRFGPDTINFSASLVFMEDSDVYMPVSTQNRPFGGNAYTIVTIWKNGEKLFTIGDGATISCVMYGMYVVNGDVYVAGAAEPEQWSLVSRAVVWKNGTPQYLNDAYSPAIPSATSVFVKDNDIYVGGRGYFYAGSGFGVVPMLWKNGVPLYLYSTGGSDGYVMNITVVDSAVYALTSLGSDPYLWKNDRIAYGYSPTDYPYLAVSSMFVNPDSLQNVGIAPQAVPPQNIRLYPNPASSYVTIELPYETENADFQLFDLQGRVLKQEKISAKSTIYIGEWQQGIYFYRILAKEKQYNGKLLIVK